MAYLLQNNKQRYFTGFKNGKPVFGRKRHAVPVEHIAAQEFSGPEFIGIKCLPILSPSVSASVQDAGQSGQECLAQLSR